MDLTRRLNNRADLCWRIKMKEKYFFIKKECKINAKNSNKIKID